mmetsp:Transcript_45123/g.119989  ORF Transcript_45123/g.119989 Transcript_45123/m.119989 type:complete len:214 (-) Transcript_45123:142-783(-)
MTVLLESLTTLTSLKELDLSDNGLGCQVTMGDDRISDVDAMSQFMMKLFSLAELKQLEKLNLSHNQLGRCFTPNSAWKVKDMNVKNVDLSRNRLNVQQAVGFVSPMKKLRKLNLSANRLCEDISSLLQAVPNVTDLNLSMNSLGEGVAVSVAKALEKYPKIFERLKSLNLSLNQIPPEQMCQLKQKCSGKSFRVKLMYLDDGLPVDEGDCECE